tara:strand:- start:20 stop:508 length:489 start_codon:yes stop_codon:yes gene_type:complete
MATVIRGSDNLDSALVSKTFAESRIHVYNYNGYGSTNNKIPRFSNTAETAGSAITYADSASLGASFTINDDGFYSMTYHIMANSSQWFGISLNSTQLTTTLYQINVADRLTASNTPALNVVTQVGVTRRLAAGDIIRPHTYGGAFNNNGGNASNEFTIERVG